MTRSLILFTIAVAVVTQGCQQKDAEPQVGSLEPAIIVPRTSVGGIQAGMTLDQVVGLLGEPQRRTANALEYTRLGFAVMPNREGVVQVVMCGDVTGSHGPLVKAFTARTKEGIGLTSTRDDLIKAYGEPTRSESFLGGRESLRYDSLGMTFSLEGGTIHHMIVRLEPASGSPSEQSKDSGSSIEVTR